MTTFRTNFAAALPVQERRVANALVDRELGAGLTPCRKVCRAAKSSKRWLRAADCTNRLSATVSSQAISNSTRPNHRSTSVAYTATPRTT